MSVLHTETWQVLRGNRDRTGDRNMAPHHTITGCVFYPSSTAQDDNRRTTVTVHAGGFIPAGSDLKPADFVQRPNGDQYRVQGFPMWGDVQHPATGWKGPGMAQVELERVI